MTIETITIDTEQRAGVQKLYEAAKAAKKYLEPDLVEPGRTVFWNLVDAIRDYEKAAAPRPAEPDGG